jgi:hypothetical protein
MLTACLASSATAQEQTNWSVEVRTDPLTSQLNGAATLTSANGDELVFACNGTVERMLSVQYLPARSLGLTAKLVSVRIGRGAIQKSLWGYVPDGAFTISPWWVDFFSRRIDDKERSIVISALNADDRPVAATFVSRGGRTAINRIRETCGERAVG